MADYDKGGVQGQPNNQSRSTLNRDARDAGVAAEAAGGETRYGMVQNPNYILRVIQDGKTVAKGYLPETFQLSVVSRFSQPFGQGVANSGAVGNAFKVLGSTTLTSQSMTMQVWDGSEPLELQFEMEFLAEKDPYKEVVEPIKKLLELVMPSQGTGGLLKPPGPQINWLDTAGDVGKSLLGSLTGATQANDAQTVKGALQGAIDGASNKISIYIGKFLAFENVVIESVNQTYHSMFDETGLPLRATVAITFKTFVVPTKEDIDKIFPTSSAGFSSDSFGGRSFSSFFGGDRGTRGGF